MVLVLDALQHNSRAPDAYLFHLSLPSRLGPLEDNVGAASNARLNEADPGPSVPRGTLSHIVRGQCIA